MHEVGRVANKVATVWIADNDSNSNTPIMSVTATAPLAKESDSVPGAFTVSRDRSTNADLTVNFTLSGTAGNGVDYTSVSNSLTIPAGAWSAPLVVAPFIDGLRESNETACVTLTVEGSYRVLPSAASACLTILDSGPPRFDLSNDQWGMTTNGFRLAVTGLSGHGPVVLYASSDMVIWEAVLTNPPVMGSVTLLDNTATNAPERYYRLLER